MKCHRNPIIPGFNPDPTIAFKDGRYYLATSTFEYFPGVPIYTSVDLVDWTLIGHALNRRSQLDMRTVECSGGIYAPSLRYNERRKRWYMTAALVLKRSKMAPHDTTPNPTGFYVWSDDINDETRWSDPIYYDVTGIDQDLFFDEGNGKIWLSWATGIPDYVAPKGCYNLAVWTVEIDLKTGDSVGEPQLIRQNTSFGNHVSEGPHVYKRNGYYYLMTAEGGTETEHSEWIFRSKAGPRGPWEDCPHNPLIYNGQDKHVMQTGHMDMVEGGDGQWWAVFLAVRNQKGVLSHLGRETFLAPVEWVEGWPVVNGGRKVSLQGVVGPPRSPNTQSWTFRFTNDLTKKGWYHLRTPLKAYHRVENGHLLLKCGPHALSQDEAVAMLLQKQTTFNGVWRVEFAFSPVQMEEEAGIAVWWSKWAYCSVSIRGGKNKAELVFRKPAEHGDGFEESVWDAPSGTVTIEIKAEPSRYSFYLLSAGARTPLGMMSAHLLVRTRPWDSKFTGTFLGLFAQGYGGFGTNNLARFKSVEWQGVLGED